MKIGFFSDVHANLAALKAVLADSESEGINKLFFLGDAVGYGPDPNECVELICAKAEAFLMGNHDYAALGLLEMDSFNQYARDAIEFTRNVLTAENTQRMLEFDLEYFYGDFHLVHSTPLNPGHWDYIMTLEDAADNFPHIKRNVCLIGHSHFPAVVVKENGAWPKMGNNDEIQIDDSRKYIINIGSVGQPRDRNPDSCYFIFDEENRIGRLKRVAYDIKETQKRMEDKNLPEYLISRLERGK